MGQQCCQECWKVSAAWQSEVEASVYSKFWKWPIMCPFSYAEQLASSNTFAHSSKSSRNSWGENLYKGWTSAKSCEADDKVMAAAVRAWADEVRRHFVGTTCLIVEWHFQKADLDPRNVASFDSAPNSGVVGHYTQEVWKDSTKLGCGFAQGKDGEAWTTCVSLIN